MILSNNPKTFIGITIYTNGCGGITYQEYIHRWTGPTAICIFNLQFTLWDKYIEDTTNYKE